MAVFWVESYRPDDGGSTDLRNAGILYRSTRRYNPEDGHVSTQLTPPKLRPLYRNTLRFIQWKCSGLISRASVLVSSERSRNRSCHHHQWLISHELRPPKRWKTTTHSNCWSPEKISLYSTALIASDIPSILRNVTFPSLSWSSYWTFPLEVFL
jgi:hypothetical protein